MGAKTKYNTSMERRDISINMTFLNSHCIWKPPPPPPPLLLPCNQAETILFRLNPYIWMASISMVHHLSYFQLDDFFITATIDRASDLLTKKKRRMKQNLNQCSTLAWKRERVHEFRKEVSNKKKKKIGSAFLQARSKRKKKQVYSNARHTAEGKKNWSCFWHFQFILTDLILNNATKNI